ncbi:MAG: septum formation initiator family protein [Nitrolancea sp.]
MKSLLSAVGVTLARMRGRLVIAFVLLIGAYFVVAFGEQAWKARQLDGEVAERQAAVDDMRAQHQALQSQVTEYSSDRYLTYVESAARRDLNLSRPGETVLLVRWQGATQATPTPQATEESSQPQRETNWSKWLSLFGLH